MEKKKKIGEYERRPYSFILKPGDKTYVVEEDFVLTHIGTIDTNTTSAGMDVLTESNYTSYYTDLLVSVWIDNKAFIDEIDPSGICPKFSRSPKSFVVGNPTPNYRIDVVKNPLKLVIPYVLKKGTMIRVKAEKLSTVNDRFYFAFYGYIHKGIEITDYVPVIYPVRVQYNEDEGVTDKILNAEITHIWAGQRYKKQDETGNNYYVWFDVVSKPLSIIFPSGHQLTFEKTLSHFILGMREHPYKLPSPIKIENGYIRVKIDKDTSDNPKRWVLFLGRKRRTL
ncbi:hypothetical protein DRJ19_01875 [Candidatus Woesearchaeota archaeon]|nr:MAG: hypothetical protein DRJ19_01875 [Candidatus Woesearchaeota archaeon]